MMHVEFLVEEPSAEAALENLVPKILRNEITYSVHPHQGKQNLLAALPGRLRGYRSWIPKDWRIVVLVDKDDDPDCLELKSVLERMAAAAGFATKAKRDSQGYYFVLNRLAIEELEAWFFGDTQAISFAYPRVPSNIGQRAKYRNPDSIRGGTWEALEKILQSAGYYKAGYLKIEGARLISAAMEPSLNRSKSFAVFRDGLLSL